MRFIHCADIHLDAPLRSVFSAGDAKAYRQEVLNNFARLVRFADENGFDGLLISGDLFDSNCTSAKTVRYVLDLFRKYPDLGIYYLAGNHDENGFSGIDDLPENLHLFGKSWKYYKIDNIRIAGGSEPNQDNLKLPTDTVNIVLLHGQVDGNGKGEYAVSLRKLRDKNIDYLAMGHIHERKEFQIDARGVACYSGCLMGRGFDECGQKGYIEIEVNGSKIGHRFVPFAPHTFFERRVDIGNCHGTFDTENLVADETKDIDKNDFCRLILTGSVSIDDKPDISALESALHDRFALLRIKDETTLAINPADYANDISLKGEFVRQVLASELDEKTKERVILCGIRALRGEELDL